MCSWEYALYDLPFIIAYEPVNAAACNTLIWSCAQCLVVPPTPNTLVCVGISCGHWGSVQSLCLFRGEGDLPVTCDCSPFPPSLFYTQISLWREATKMLDQSFVLSYICKRKSLIDSPRPWETHNENNIKTSMHCNWPTWHPASYSLVDTAENALQCSYSTNI